MTSGFVDLKNAHSYLDCKEKYMKKGRGQTNFSDAVKQCDDFINDPYVRIIFFVMFGDRCLLKSFISFFILFTVISSTTN